MPYLDKVTGKKMDGIKTSDIYKGAIPFILIQTAMIFVVVLLPGLVMHYKGKVVDASTVTIEIPALQPLAPIGGAPTLGAPTLGEPVVNP